MPSMMTEVFVIRPSIYWAFRLGTRAQGCALLASVAKITTLHIGMRHKRSCASSYAIARGKRSDIDSWDLTQSASNPPKSVVTIVLIGSPNGCAVFG
jgi:hypothetical protein